MFTPVPAESLPPYGLRVDGRPSPALGVASDAPRLAWRLPSRIAGGDRVVVEAAASEEDLATRTRLMWSENLPLRQNALDWAAPAPLQGSTVHWRVGMIAASDRSLIEWSDAASFEPALPDDGWHANWITSPEWADPPHAFNGPPPVLARDFTVRSGIVKARLHLAAAGVADIRLNGSPVSDEVLGFGYSVERRRLPARTIDVTRLVTPGLNRLRVTLAGGISWVPPIADRYTKLTTAALPPRLIARVEITHDDAGVTAIGTDDEWRTSEGPVRMSHWFGGEDIDGRIPEPDFPTGHTGWRACVTLGDATLHRPWWISRPPLRIVDRLPGSVHAVSRERVIVDFGINVAGWPVLDLHGCAEGDVVVVRPAEILADGEIDQRTTGSPLWDSYVARKGDQQWHPRHVYHGFRYIEVTGIPPERFTAAAAVIRADNESVGDLTTSDEFLSTLHTIIDRAVQGNMYSVFTDCPNREKLGWIEQLYLCFGVLSRLYDVEAHLRDTLQLMRDAQLPSGLVPSIVPQTTDFSGIPWDGDPTGFVDDVNWGGAIGFLPLRHFREYGDRRVLEENADALGAYLEHLESRARDDILDFGLGDWVALDETTPRAMVATYGWVKLLRASSEIRRLLDDDDGARVLAERAAEVADQFARRFRDGPTWGSGNQASYAFAIDLDVVSEQEAAGTFDRLLATIADAEGRLTVGENSWPAIVRVLHQHGRDDLISRMVRNDDGPGYGLQIALGATALAETWRGASGAMYENSQNHFMLGMIHDWIAEDIGGLSQSAASAGWARADLQPGSPTGADRMSVGQTTTRGRYALAAGAGSLTIEVPAGAEALVTFDDARHLLTGGRWEWRP